MAWLLWGGLSFTVSSHDPSRAWPGSISILPPRRSFYRTSLSWMAYFLDHDFGTGNPRYQNECRLAMRNLNKRYFLPCERYVFEIHPGSVRHMSLLALVSGTTGRMVRGTNIKSQGQKQRKYKTWSQIATFRLFSVLETIAHDLFSWNQAHRETPSVSVIADPPTNLLFTSFQRRIDLEQTGLSSLDQYELLLCVPCACVLRFVDYGSRGWHGSNSSSSAPWC